MNTIRSPCRWWAHHAGVFRGGSPVRHRGELARLENGAVAALAKIWWLTQVTSTVGNLAGYSYTRSSLDAGLANLGPSALAR